jgi:DNA repair protein RecO (recombination protein O)
LNDAFGWICVAGDLPLVARYYEIHLLGLAGYQPQLFFCGGCRRQLEPEVNYLSPAEGSVFCSSCGRQQVGSLELSINALKVLRFLQTREWPTCQHLRLSPASHAEIERTMYHYITYHLERKLRSVDLIQRLRRQLGTG